MRIFQTPKDSATGIKLAEIRTRAKQCKDAAVQLQNELGAKQSRKAYFVAFGGISMFIFEIGAIIPQGLRKNKYGEYEPSDSKKGREISEKMRKLPTIETKEINSIFGITDNFGKCIGWDFGLKDFYVIKTDESWDDVIMPTDCLEITFGQFELMEKE